MSTLPKTKKPPQGTFFCGWNMGLAQREAQIAARETSKNLGLRALTSTDFLCVDSAGYIVVRRDGDVY